MKLVSYQSFGQARFGAVIGAGIVDMARASAALAATDAAIRPLPATIEPFLAQTDVLDASARAVVTAAEAGALDLYCLPLDGTVLLPPVPRPTKIICVARNYAEHAREAGLQISDIPILFPRFANTQIGQGAPIVVPAVSHQLDWEGELAVVLGRGSHGRRIGKAEAMDLVYGYTIFNDVSVRDYQFRVTQYTGGKNFRHSGPCGPYLVTKDEIADPHKVQIVTRINGVLKQSANTDTMIFDIPTILEHIADFIDLEAGDLIPTGTPAGVGFKRNPPEFLKDGDVIEVEVTGLGILRNPVVNEAVV
ncbi:fumarylacetoacetate hydrolase family protein [Gemmobacter fulvus]|uniref:fumarylacetoacetate hydrolase family protein n=1 Tax=Gemmobacter fulvus TaxID=2840474 RepID=UPI002796B09A|nr:fumarylacetoacetate hydrolase family protein [Gemmobacter fulvus]MDQ1850244.1 fumarylacetoacetate hydrolase family protein [Gemmobacter fulvus]